MNTDPAITVKNINKSFKLPTSRKMTLQSYFTHPFERQEFRKFVALKDVSFEVGKGEFFSIIGKNGSGKSTLLKILAGIYMPDSGKVTIRGKMVPFLELGVGFHPELTARENVILNGTLLGLTHNEIANKVPEVLEFSELTDFKEVPVKNFSSGMQVRLAFSVAIRANADILLLDEVLAVGDGSFQHKCFDYFDSIKGKKSIVFVSHDMKSVVKYSDRVMYLQDDNKYEIGDAKDVVAKYEKSS
jgi:ABC-2 type transport system ATP-binding protein